MTRSQSLFLLTPLALAGVQELVEPTVDLSKHAVEVDLEAVLGASAPAPQALPFGTKFLVEDPLEQALAAAAARQEERVQPGLVAWHADLEAAIVAARESGKPVLLFQLLGDLDDAFC